MLEPGTPAFIAQRNFELKSAAGGIYGGPGTTPVTGQQLWQALQSNTSEYSRLTLLQAAQELYAKGGGPRQPQVLNHTGKPLPSGASNLDSSFTYSNPSKTGTQRYLTDYEISELTRSGGAAAVQKAVSLRMGAEYVGGSAGDIKKSQANLAVAALINNNKSPKPPAAYDPVAEAVRTNALQASRIKSENDAAATAEVRRQQESSRQAAAYAAAQLKQSSDYIARSNAEAAANKIAYDKWEAKWQAEQAAIREQASSFEKQMSEASFKRALDAQAAAQAESKAAQDRADKVMAELKAAREAADKASTLEAAKAAAQAAAQREKDASEAKARAQQELKATQDEITRKQIEYNAKFGGGSIPSLPPELTSQSNLISVTLSKAVEDAKAAAVASAAARGIPAIGKPFVSSATFTAGLDKAANIKGQAELTAAARAAAVASGLNAEDTKTLMSTVAKAIAKPRGKKQPAKLKPKAKAKNNALPKPKKRR